MKIKKKLTRKQLLKQEDEFISTSAKVIMWIKENYNKVIMSLILVLIAMAVIFSVRYRVKTNIINSNKLLYVAKNIYYAPIPPPAQQQDPSIPPQGFTSSGEKYRNAIQLFQELIQIYPKSEAAEEAEFFIPNCLYFLESYDQAIEGFEKYLDRYSKGIFVHQSHVGIGFVHVAKGDYDKAITVFQQILDNYPEFILRDALYMQLGHSFENLGSIDKAKEAYQNVIINFPDSPFLKDAEDKVNMLAEKG